MTFGNIVEGKQKNKILEEAGPDLKKLSFSIIQSTIIKYKQQAAIKDVAQKKGQPLKLLKAITNGKIARTAKTVLKSNVTPADDATLESAPYCAKKECADPNHFGFLDVNACK